MIKVEYETLSGEDRSFACRAIQEKTDEMFECQDDTGFPMDTFRKRDLKRARTKTQETMYVRTNVGSPRVDECVKVENIEDSKFACTRRTGETKLFNIEDVENLS